MQFSTDRFTKIRQGFMPLVFLVAGLILTMVGWIYINNIQESADVERLEIQAEQFSEAVRDRMSDYAQALISARGFFLSSEDVSRDEFRIFTESLNADIYLPGIQGIGYSIYLGGKENVGPFEAQIRREGFEDFVVHPDDPRDEYHSIQFLEPFDIRNQRAFGYDMHSQETRREAMDAARDSGEPVLSGRVILLQEFSEDVQAGTLLYVPYYTNGTDPQTESERREFLEGFVYAPLRMSNVFTPVLDEVPLENLVMRIYDGPDVDQGQIMFDGMRDVTDDALLAWGTTHTLTIYGKVWTIEYRALKQPFVLSFTSPKTLLLLAGTIISILLYALAHSLQKNTQTAEARARKIAEEMSSSDETWRLALETNGHWMWKWNAQKNTFTLLDEWLKSLGYSPKDIVTRDQWVQLIHPDDAELLKHELDKHIRGKQPFFNAEYRIRKKNGSYLWIKERGRAISRSGKDVHQLIGTHTDISERKNHEQEKQERYAELERVNELMVGRELKMQELKKRLEALEENISPDDSIS